MSRVRRVVSGGQTGVDQAALRAAMALGIEIGGWCPPGRVCEGGTIPEELPLVPTPEERSVHAPDIPRSLRTEWNVSDSDGTLVIRPSVERAPDPGTSFTEEWAARLGRPCLVVRVGIHDGGAEDEECIGAVRQWLRLEEIDILNIAGPSESAVPGIGEYAYALMLRILGPSIGESEDSQELERAQ